MPLDLARIGEEDLVNFELVEEKKTRSEDASTKTSTDLGVPNVEIMDEFETHINHRGQAY